MFTIGLLMICRPLIRPVELFDEPFGQQALEVTHKDDVVFTVEVNPTVIAMAGVVTLCLTGRYAIENFVKLLLVDIP